MNAEEFLQRLRDAGVLPPAMKYPHGHKLSRFITTGIDHVASPDTGECWLHQPLLALFDEARAFIGHPVPVRAGSRTHAYELSLEAAGYKTAKFVSPHSLSAIDCDAMPRDGKTEAAVNVGIRTELVRAATKLGFPEPRLGFKAYGERFTHCDLVFLFFEPHTTLAHPATWPDLSPEQQRLVAAWKPGVRW
jgi:hypothetical protein